MAINPLAAGAAASIIVLSVVSVVTVHDSKVRHPERLSVAMAATAKPIQKPCADCGVVVEVKDAAAQDVEDPDFRHPADLEGRRPRAPAERQAHRLAPKEKTAPKEKAGQTPATGLRLIAGADRPWYSDMDPSLSPSS